MKIIALTGGIGSGKSTVSAILKELGAEVLDSDKLAHEVRDTIALKEVTAAFGTEILAPQGSIDRQKLAGIVFNDPQALAKLNRIIHPKLEAEINQRLKTFAEKGTNIVVIEVPLIGEAEWPTRADQIWVVKTSRESTLKRLEARGLSESAALVRMANQTPPEEHIKRGMVIIENNGTYQDLRARVEKLWEGIHNKKRR
ncbi:MAG TPA: dephospho-CoA kinase [Dehalococcoidales bacterium]